MHTLLLHLVMSLSQIAGAAGPSPVVAAPIKLQSAPASYWIAKKVSVDVDKSLGKYGIVAEFCTFRRTNPAKEISHHGLGPCLYDNFLASMKTDALAGTTYAWVKDDQGQLHRVDIQWRPPLGGWSQLTKQYMNTRFESRVAKSVTIPYKEFITGDLKITLPNDEALMTTLLKKSSPEVRAYLAAIHTVSFHLAPTGKVQEKVIYTGQLLLENSPDEDGMITSHTAYIKTDINPLKQDRPFFLQVRVRQGTDAADIPDLSKMAPADSSVPVDEGSDNTLEELP
jgi:hypothetical protein